MILSGNDSNILDIKHKLELKGHEITLKSYYRYNISELTLVLDRDVSNNVIMYTSDVPKSLVKSLMKLYQVRDKEEVLGINTVHILHNHDVDSSTVVNRINLLVGGYNYLYKERDY
jgi:hypothetical protein